METVAWREIPAAYVGKKIDEQDYLAAAQVRNTHRAAISVRWRSKEARAEDKSMGRLPDKWHEWMACCPADEYQQANKDGSFICTCDSWYEQSRRQRPSQNRLEAWQAAHAREQELIALEAASVKSIDTGVHIDTIPEIVITKEVNEQQSPEPYLYFRIGGREPEPASGIRLVRRAQGNRPKRARNRIRRRLPTGFEARVSREGRHLCAV